MPESIFLFGENRQLVGRLDREGFATEDELQALLAAVPDLIPGDEVNPGDPRRWLLVDREISVPDSEDSAGRWSLDHLFLDQDAIPTIIEVKRSSDTRLRREVVGQMLDYAANGVRYWPVEDLRQHVRNRCESESITEQEKLNEIASTHADADEYWAEVKVNLRSGRIRMIFVADEIPDELVRIIEFLNDQMTAAEVLGVELQQFAGADATTVVPKLVGATSTARAIKGHKPKVEYPELLDQAAPETREFARLVEQHCDRMGLHSRRTAAGMAWEDDANVGFMFYPGYNTAEFYIGPIADVLGESAVAPLREKFERIGGSRVAKRHPSLLTADLVEHWVYFEEELLPTYREFGAKARSASRS